MKMDIEFIRAMIAEYKTMPIIHRLEASQSPKWHTATEVLLQKVEQQDNELTALRAQVNELRYVLSVVKEYANNYNSNVSGHQNAFDMSVTVLNRTQEQSLTAHDNEVIERCRKLASSRLNNEDDYSIGYNVAAAAIEEAIRNLKTDPQLAEEE